MSVSLGGRVLFTARDTALTGNVGVWTKADGLTAFEDFSVTVLKE